MAPPFGSGDLTCPLRPGEQNRETERVREREDRERQRETTASCTVWTNPPLPRPLAQDEARTAAAVSSSTWTSPPPPPPALSRDLPPPPPAQEATPSEFHDADSDDQLNDPLQELFGIESKTLVKNSPTSPRKRTPIRAMAIMASPPAALTPPPLPDTGEAALSSSASSRPRTRSTTPTTKTTPGETPKTEQPARRGPLQAGAARAISAEPALTLATAPHGPVPDEAQTARRQLDPEIPVLPVLPKAPRDPQLHDSGELEQHTAAADSALHGKADDKESLGDSPERQARDAELDSISWAILEPLPPGWQMGDMARSRRLHPFLDVFDDDPAADDPEPEQDYHEDEEAGTCDASVLPVPFHFDTGEIPGRSGSPAAEHDLNAADDAPPSPVGPPPTLSAQQRARLHALLQQRDEQGHTPFGVDDYHTDTAKWAAYSKGELPRTPKAPASSRNLDQRPTAGSRPELQKGTFSTPSTTHGGSPLPRGRGRPESTEGHNAD